MDSTVPILIPFVNADHIELVKAQKYYKDTNGFGFIVTNANCSSTGICVALKPFNEMFGGISEMFVTTLQAVSGAGYPGLPAIDCIDNIIPFISGEEEKIETEPSKILGKLNFHGDGIEHAAMRVTAMCHRVPVSDGHTASVSLKFKSVPLSLTPDDVLTTARSAIRSFQVPQLVSQLPSCPSAQPIILRTEEDRPQPRLDRSQGMQAVVGRLRSCPLMDVKLTVLSHNTLLGAAGGSILNAELAIAKGLVLRGEKRER
eukprot:GDKJ01053723.1.p1 GENE.GDKJ01053723.1~~GDKJ01053723.1.p1  ORF type:complete len:259 (+),score=30.45 GDKJ01053723.1:419-1195(+)